MNIVNSILAFFISKKKIIGYLATLIIAAVAGALGMKSSEVKDAVCGAPVIEIPAPVIPGAPIEKVK